jgi:hypothetical protein
VVATILVKTKILDARPDFASGGEGKRNELNWLRFVNTTNRFQELKHHTLYLSLNQIHSERFFTDRGYRALMEKVVLKNISKQLYLRFDEHLPSKSFHKHFSHLHALKLEDVTEESPRSGGISRGDSTCLGPVFV